MGTVQRGKGYCRLREIHAVLLYLHVKAVFSVQILTYSFFLKIEKHMEAHENFKKKICHLNGIMKNEYLKIIINL